MTLPTARSLELDQSEADMLALLEGGASALEIARTLGLAPGVVEARLAALHRRAAGARPAAGAVDLAPFRLTPKQEQVLRLVLDGDTNPTIARKLYLTRSAVAFHLRRIYGKLGVEHRLGAIALVRRQDR